MWKTTNALGQEMVWYSEDEYNELKEELDYFEKCHKDLDNYIPAIRMGEFCYIKKSEVFNGNELDKLKQENEALKNNDVFSIRLLKDKADRYKQALKEIKEIAKECEKTKNCSNCYFFTECDDNGYGLIIKKISEVINE